jgi:FkbM family methyltransferase
MIKDNKTGLFYRNEAELYVIKERSQYRHLDFEGKTFMDIGAHIGAATDLALQNKVKKCVSYEPMEETFKMLRLNIKDNTKAQLHQSAMVSDDLKTVDFYLHHKYPSCNSLLPIKKGTKITVPCLNFAEQLEKHKPEVLKVDCEGGEFLLLNQKLPHHVEQLAVEFHLKSKEAKHTAWEILQNNFSDWYVHRKFRFNWYVTTAVLKKDVVSDHGTVAQYMEQLSIQ